MEPAGSLLMAERFQEKIKGVGKAQTYTEN